ncbi:MAG TPA: hypothetical protein VHR45_08345 [Thermoanaerobaculia bacterium]|nr:hypothetical protein [Thermoanaerobaculia bacterium]
MPLVVRAFPLLAGKEQDLRDFARQVAVGRSAEAAEFYRGFGVARESWHLQQSVAGPLVIAVTDLKEIDETARAYATSERSFDRWFKDQVQRLTGVSPDQDPLGPPTEQIFEWRERG